MKIKQKCDQEELVYNVTVVHHHVYLPYDGALLMEPDAVSVPTLRDVIHAGTNVDLPGQYKMSVRYRYNIMELPSGYKYSVVYDKENDHIFIFREAES